MALKFPRFKPYKNVWAILKEKLSKRKIKNLDELRENILDIQVKFSKSLCEKLCAQFEDKIKYIKDSGGKRINKEIIRKILFNKENQKIKKEEAKKFINP